MKKGVFSTSPPVCLFFFFLLFSSLCLWACMMYTSIREPVSSSLVISIIDHTTLTYYSPPPIPDSYAWLLTHITDAFFSLYMLLISRVWHGPCATYAIYASALASDPKMFVCSLLVLRINYPHCSRTEGNYGGTRADARTVQRRSTVPGRMVGNVWEG